jgi:hypothetical protein
VLQQVEALARYDANLGTGGLGFSFLHIRITYAFVCATVPAIDPRAHPRVPLSNHLAKMCSYHLPPRH